MKICTAGYEPNTLALGHFHGLGNFGESENAGVKRTSAVFAGDGDGDLHVVDAEDWHACRSLNSCLREIGHGVGGFHEFFKGGHYGGAGEEFAEEFDFAAEFLVRDGLDEFFGGGTGDSVEFGDLCGGGAGDFQGFALGGELRDEADGLRARGVDAASGEKQIADEGVAEVALEARDAAKAWDQAQAQLRKSEARHLVGNDDVAGERQLESAAEADAVNGGDGDERCGIDGVEYGVDALDELADGC